MKPSDIITIGPGMRGASVTASLAPTGRRMVILERGDFDPEAQRHACSFTAASDVPATRDRDPRMSSARQNSALIHRVILTNAHALRGTCTGDGLDSCQKDHEPNGSCLTGSPGVNPSLAASALAWRAARHIQDTECAA